MNRTQIVHCIRQRFVKRKPLNLSAVKRDDPQLVEAVYAVQPYWGWRAALTDAGIDYDSIRVELRQTVECHICGKRYHLLPVHLIKTHEITSEDYLESYPGAELVSEELRENMTGVAITPRHPDFIEHWEPIYTPEYVLDRLNAYAEQGYWMERENIHKIDCTLIFAISKYLNIDWDTALRRIGLDPTEMRGIVRDDDYTLDDFRKWLEEREAKGLSCTHGVIMQEYDEWRRRPRMYVWAIRQYASWHQALLAAGVDLAKPVYGGHHFLTRQQVLDEICRMRDAEEDLSHAAVSLLPLGGQLTSAASKFYGTWTAALDAAEVPQQLRTRQVSYETREDVLGAIAQRIENQFSLAPLELYYGYRSDVPLWKKTFELFGSWHKGVTQASDNVEHRRQARDTLFPSKAKVIEEIRRRGEAGQLLAKREMTHEETDKHLYVMAIGYFGSWQGAIRSAGFDPREYHQWNLHPPGKYASEQEVIAAIKQRHRKKHPLNARGLTHGKHQDVPLIYTARKLFGSWEQAVTVAGIDYGSVTRKKQDYTRMEGRVYQSYETREEVIQAIKKRIDKGLPITYRSIEHGDIRFRDNALLIAGKKLFDGDWDNALVAAGLNLEDVHPAWVLERKRKKREALADTKQRKAKR